MTEFTIREIGLTDLEQVASIHIASFHDRALSQLGKGAVQRYYHWLLTGFPKRFPLCAVSPDQQLAGYCFAGVYAGSFSGFLEHNRWYLLSRMVMRPWLLFNPLVRMQAGLALKTLWKLFKKRMPNRKEIPIEHKVKPNESINQDLGVLSIAVHPSFQRQGVGALLMRAIEKKAVESGYSQMHLSVHPDNLPAVNFYQRLGWQKSTSDGEWDGKMFKRLTHGD
jgi:ribosomal protein S18 acetylase RimI-like enzyme